MPNMRMKDGIKAEPSWRRQAILPVSLTITLAAKPRKIPAGDDEQCLRTSTLNQLTGHDPKLPEHDKGTSNPSWGHLG